MKNEYNFKEKHQNDLVENQYRCATDNMTNEIVVGISDTIHLWTEGQTIILWSFDSSTPEDIKSHLRNLFQEAFALWGDSSPIKFDEID